MGRVSKVLSIRIRYRFIPIVGTSKRFQELLADNSITRPMSRTGNVWDNAAIYSFFLSLKTERVSRKTYRTREEAKADVLNLH